MISTAIAASANASVGSGPKTSQTRRSAPRDEDGRHEDRGDAIGQALDRRLRALRLARRGGRSGRAPCRAPTLVGAQDEGAGRVERRPDDPVAGPFSTGRLSPVSIDSSSAERPSRTDAVDRHLLAGPHAHEVADADLLDRHVDARAVAETRAVAAASPISAGWRRRSALGAGLQPAAEQDQRDDDHRGLEVQSRGKPRCAPAAARGSRTRVAIRDAGADRDQRVHVGRAVARRAPGGAVERRPPAQNWTTAAAMRNARRQHGHRRARAAGT